MVVQAWPPRHGQRSWILWTGTVGFERSVAERIEVAVAEGFDTISISPPMSWCWRDARTIGERVRDAGLTCILDPVLAWHPGNSGAVTLRSRTIDVETVIRMCDDLRAESLSAVAWPEGCRDVTELADHFGTLCDKAAEVGTRVHLEFIPMTVVPDARTAREIVSVANRANRANGGVLVDSWHFFCGSADFDALAAIPGDRIFAVQLNDAAAPVSSSLWEDTDQRCLPGDGEFELDRFVSVLRASGALTRSGPEVISPATAAMPARDAAASARRRVEALLAGT